MTPVIMAAGILLILVTFGYILYPLFRASAPGGHDFQRSLEADRLAELFSQRDAVYEAIRDLDFDFQMGKLTEEDHRAMRERLTAQGVSILQDLDRVGLGLQTTPIGAGTPEDLEAEIEREVAALRKKPPAGEPVAARATTIEEPRTTCPVCHEPARRDATFCARCGAALALACPACQAPVEAGDRFCSHCGVALSAGGQASRPAEEAQTT